MEAGGSSVQDGCVTRVLFGVGADVFIHNNVEKNTEREVSKVMIECDLRLSMKCCVMQRANAYLCPQSRPST